MTIYGVSIKVEGNNYIFSVGSRAGVRDLVCHTTATIDEIQVVEQSQTAYRTLSDGEILKLLLTR